MVRVGLGVALALALGWVFLGRGGDAKAVTSCLEKAGATVTESPRFGQLFPYAIAVRTLDRVESYPELEGGRFYNVAYGNDRAMLFVARDGDAAEAFESTLVSLLSKEGGTLTSRRDGKSLLVWERQTYAPDVDACVS
jgi:hypothetical protein